ncbi:hypothetical protein BLA29_013720, partial [Euroglyphus maynei]
PNFDTFDDPLEAKESVTITDTVAAPLPAESSTTTSSTSESTSPTADEKETATTSTTTAATTTVEPTTTALPADLELPASASAPTSVYVPRPSESSARIPPGAVPAIPRPAINRVWHFNNRGVNSNAVWPRSNNQDSEAVESS